MLFSRENAGPRGSRLDPSSAFRIRAWNRQRLHYGPWGYQGRAFGSGLSGLDFWIRSACATSGSSAFPVWRSLKPLYPFRAGVRMRNPQGCPFRDFWKTSAPPGSTAILLYAVISVSLRPRRLRRPPSTSTDVIGRIHPEDPRRNCGGIAAEFGRNRVMPQLTPGSLHALYQYIRAGAHSRPAAPRPVPGTRMQRPRSRIYRRPR